MRVLVVDDERSIVTGVRRALEGAGYEVDTAEDGRVGLERALTGRYAAVILDVMLPTMNGYRVCRAIREANVPTAIVMLTVKRGEWDLADAFDLGADDYLTKPFSTVELVARVHARTRRGFGTAGAVLRFDPALRRCYRGTTEIQLTRRETRLLEILVEEADHVVTKADLVARAWGAEFAGDPNVVEVCIGRLRRKIDRPFGTDDIETVRGVGYRLRAGNLPP